MNAVVAATVETTDRPLIIKWIPASCSFTHSSTTDAI
jgi:hypothetical protein